MKAYFSFTYQAILFKFQPTWQWNIYFSKLDKLKTPLLTPYTTEARF